MDLSRIRPSRRTAAAVVAALSIGAVVAVGSAVAGRGASSSYRTAAVSEQEVDQILRSVGSIEPVSQAAVAFPVAGTVSRVDVETGNQVVVGEALASLDVDDLTVALHEAEATYDQASLSLELALAGEDPGAVAGGAPNGGFGRAVRSGSNSELREAQEAVLAAQRSVDAAMSTAEAALANATMVCEDQTPTTTSTTPATTTSAPAASGAAADSEVCQAALASSLSAQQELSAAQAELIEASNALTALLEEAAGEEPDSGTPAPSVPESNGAPSGGSSGLPSGGATEAPTGGASIERGTTNSPSAEELVAYQKAVDAAALEVVVAQHAVDQATIVSPIEGTVVSVGMAAGDSVTAGSATQAIVIAGEGGYEVTTSISVTDLPDVAVGQEAEVVPDGATEAISGKVVRIGVAPETSGSGDTYTLTIGLNGDTSSLGNGSVASVAIVTESSGLGLAVPTSAVTLTGDQATVTKVVDGEATETDVEIGPIGDTWISITSGLTEGDIVVIADLDEPLPGSATDTSASGDTTVTGFPGGGSFPGGFRPGG